MVTLAGACEPKTSSKMNTAEKAFHKISERVVVQNIKRYLKTLSCAHCMYCFGFAYGRDRDGSSDPLPGRQP